MSSGVKRRVIQIFYRKCRRVPIAISKNRIELGMVSLPDECIDHPVKIEVLEK